MKHFHQNKGMALAISLMVVTVIITLSTIYVTRAVFEKSMSDREVRNTKALYAAEAGGNAALDKLGTLINTNMLTTVNGINPSNLSSQVSNYVANNNSIGFLYNYTKNGNTYLLNQSGSQATYSGSNTSINTTGSYIYTIIIKMNGNPSSTAAPSWNFPYTYQIQTTGTDGSQKIKFTLNGTFSIQVRKDNFARYALFTNTQTLPSGSAVWFTSSTNFVGPMFTNGRYNFAGNPSATFTGSVSQVSSTASFYNNGSAINLNANNNGTIDVPVFQGGYTRSASSLSMPSTSQESSMQSEANGGNSYNSNGIYVPVSGSTVNGGIYVRGDATISMSVDNSNRPVYTIVQGSSTRKITVDRSANQTIVLNTSNNNSSTYTGLPDGQDHVGTTSTNIGTIIYVNGNVTSLSGTVQRNTQMIVAAHNDIVIQNNINYQDRTAAVGTFGSPGYSPPSAENYVNLLGILSWNGDVRIGSSAPNNVNIDATVMAQSGVFSVDNYDSGNVRGTATVLGGVITNNYGAFGTFNGGSGQSLTGYGRNFTYDTRMQTQYTPPYFPTLSTFVAVTNDISKKFWQSGGF